MHDQLIKDKVAMREQINKVKEYVLDQAPQIVTATASVVLVGIALKARKEYRSYLIEKTLSIMAMQTAIPEMIKSGRPFTFYPEVGAFWDDLK